MCSYVPLLAFALGGQELLIIFAVLLLLFGATRLPKLARALGQSVTEFKGGIATGKESGSPPAEDSAEKR